MDNKRHAIGYGFFPIETMHLIKVIMLYIVGERNTHYEPRTNNKSERRTGKRIY